MQRVDGDDLFVDRAGVERKSILTLKEDPELELLLLENTGQELTPAQKTFRGRWLN